MTVLKRVKQRYEHSGGGFKIVTVVGFVDSGKDGVLAVFIDENGRFASDRLENLSVDREDRP